MEGNPAPAEGLTDDEGLIDWLADGDRLADGLTLADPPTLSTATMKAPHGSAAPLKLACVLSPVGPGPANDPDAT